MIRTEHLRKEFDGHVAIENLTLTVQRGDVYGLIGPNGAGKTTLLRILATLDRPTYGEVLIDGVSPEVDPKAIHRRMGFMPDFHHIHEDMTVRDYLEYFARGYKLDAAVREKRLRHILDFLALEGKADSRVGTLSRGMKQRVCLARTILHDPDLLLLDEPTSGLDPRSRLDFRAIVKQLAAEGKTIVISSHILEDLADFCNAVGILERGRLVQSGRIASIVAQMQASTRLTVQFLAEPERAAAILRDSPLLSEVIVDGLAVRASFRGDAAAQADLLGTLIAAGLRVASFEAARPGLEQIFMERSTHEVG